MGILKNIGTSVKSFFGGSKDVLSGNFGADIPIILPLMQGGFWDFGDSGMREYIRAYKDCPPLSAIINYIATSYSNGDTWILEREYDNKEKEFFDKESNKLRKLLLHPNPRQTFAELETETIICLKLFGFTAWYLDLPAGFSDRLDANAIYNIPPNLLRIEEDNETFLYSGNKSGIKSVTLCMKNGIERKLNVNNVFFLKDTTMLRENSVLPSSIVDTIKMPIRNIVGAYESRNSLINNRGAQGMIVNKTKDSSSFIPLNPTEQKELEDYYKSKYGMLKNQNHTIITNKDLDFVRTILPVKELMLMEEDENSSDKICNALMFPKEILANMGAGTTFSNMQTATRNLYQNCIIPLSKNVYSQINNIFETYEKKWYIEKDYTERVTALQPDLKERAERKLRTNQAAQIAFRNNIISYNEWRRELGENPREGYDNIYYSDIKHLLDNEGVNIENDQVEDNINPRGEDNTGEPGQQA